jgi:hypothetical protein
MRVIRMSFTVACLVMATSAQAQQNAGSNENGRWVVVPANSNPVMNPDTESPLMFAWRLDTRTGALEMCKYDPGGWTTNAKKIAPEALNCTQASPATNDPLGIR